MSDSPLRPAENSRQAQLLRAATRVLASAGLRGLTHRAVDREAGFPEGTCSVSYRTRAKLLAALTQFVGSQLADDVREMGESIPSGSTDPLTSLPAASALLERWATEDDGVTLVAVLELSLESLRVPELVPAIGEWSAELVRLVESIMRRHDPADARERAETVVASIQGIVLAAMTKPTEQRGNYIREKLRLVLLGTASK